MRPGGYLFSHHHTACVFLCILSTTTNPVHVDAKNIFYSEALDIIEETNRVPMRTTGLQIFFNSDSDRGNGVHPNFKPQRRLHGQLSIPYFTLLNSSNTIYPDLAIRASDGSSLVPFCNILLSDDERNFSCDASRAHRSLCPDQ
jgi:hypothetical protein